MNSVILIGNLTRDPELLETSGGIKCCKLGVAVPRSYKSGNGNREVDFFNCTAWRGLAESVARYCDKGSKVCILGSIQNRSYTDKSGNKRTVTEIVAENVEFLTMKIRPEDDIADDDPLFDGVSVVDDNDLPF